MPRSCPSQIRYGLGTINPAPGGRFDCFLLVDGKRYRARKDSLEAARIWIDTQEDASNAARPPLSKIQIADATHAVSILPPGYTLTDAARALAEAQGPDQANGITMDAALDRFLAARSVSARPVTLRAYRGAVERLERVTGSIQVQSVTPGHVEAFLAGKTPGTRNTALRQLAAFFHWCQAEDLIKTAPTDRTAKARPPEPPRGVLTPAEARSLMNAAVKLAPALVPYLALGLFAGIRPGELERLPPGKIGREFIMLDGAMTKGANARSIRIRPNLRAWLKAYSPPPGRPVAPFNGKNRRSAMKRVIVEAGIVWKHDCMRHSYATYAYELTHDAALVASEMGHQGTGIFFRHYRALCGPGDGKRFFAIAPKKPGYSKSIPKARKKANKTTGTSVS